MERKLRLVDFYITCANDTCKRKFVKGDINRVEVDVKLDGITNHYIYCSDSCFRKTLDKLNSKNNRFDPVLKIDYKEKISENPAKWLIICKAEFPEIRLVN